MVFSNLQDDYINHQNVPNTYEKKFLPTTNYFHSEFPYEAIGYLQNYLSDDVLQQIIPLSWFVRYRTYVGNLELLRLRMIAKYHATSMLNVKANFI